MLRLLILMFSVSVALLGDTSLESFATHAPCGILATVEEVEVLSEDDVLTRYSLDDRYQWFVVKGTFQILEILEGSECPHMPPSIDVLFSEEVHSSKPAEGQTVALFPSKLKGAWLEAVYGRSYWAVTAEKSAWMVHVDFRNDFLLGAIDLQNRETAEVPLSAVTRALRKARASDGH